MLEPPPTRRKFIHAWDEIEYLYAKAAYWAHHRDMPKKAERFLPRLKRLVSRHDRNHEAILGVECMALISDLDGDLEREIYWSEFLINMLRKALKKISTKELGRNWGDVRDQMEILACLHSEAGRMDRALATVRKCDGLCKAHNIPFDADAERAYLRS
jgi:hypothetical protein